MPSNEYDARFHAQQKKIGLDRIHMGVDMEKSFKTFFFSPLLNGHLSWEPYEEVALLVHKKLTSNQGDNFNLFDIIYMCLNIEIEVKNEYV